MHDRQGCMHEHQCAAQPHMMYSQPCINDAAGNMHFQLPLEQAKCKDGCNTQMSSKQLQMDSPNTSTPHIIQWRLRLGNAKAPLIQADSTQTGYPRCIPDTTP
eukprot:GHRR01003150.1.p1 GENE.GHRR01003150.1~~GHRR01003150.1.p1  ORF type:complete len:103 (-),score=21.44 GHRR01003150.1:665-973(-)